MRNPPRLREERFKRYVMAFRYGNADVSGDSGKRNGLTQAWLSSSLKISPSEQLRFLQDLVNHRLPVTGRAYKMTEKITALPTLANGWGIHGKAGTGFPVNAVGSLDEEHSYGWFVGWATKGTRTLAFAFCTQDDKPKPVRAGVRAREEFLRAFPDVMKKH